MPILTEALVKASEQMKEGWTRMKILEGKVVTKDSVTSDYVLLEGLEGPGNGSDNVNRRITAMWNGKAMDSANPVPDVVANMLGFIAAANKLSMAEVKELRGEINLNSFAGKEVWGEVKDVVYNGKLYKNIVSWSPNDVIPF